MRAVENLRHAIAGDAFKGRSVEASDKIHHVPVQDAEQVAAVFARKKLRDKCEDLRPSQNFVLVGCLPLLGDGTTIVPLEVVMQPGGLLPVPGPAEYREEERLVIRQDLLREPDAVVHEKTDAIKFVLRPYISLCNSFKCMVGIACLLGGQAACDHVT